MRKSRAKALRNELNLPQVPHRTEVEAPISPEEKLLSQILHSGQKRVIIVEGKTDKLIYGWMRDRFSTGRARVWYAGSITQLLAIHQEKTTLFDNRGVAVAFMADRDLGRLFNENPHPGDIVWTEGYCIENDLYEGFAKDLEDLLEDPEVTDFEDMRDSIVEWFAFEVEEFKAGRQHQTGKDLNELVLPGETQVDPAFLKGRSFRPPSPESISELKEEYNLRVAGKLLFQMLNRFLGNPARKRYPGSQFYTLKQMYELAGKSTSNSKTQRLINEIEEELDKRAKAIAVKKPRSRKRKITVRLRTI